LIGSLLKTAATGAKFVGGEKFTDH